MVEADIGHATMSHFAPEAGIDFTVLCQNLPKERYAMTNDADSIPLRHLHSRDDPLSEIALEAARRMSAAAHPPEADAIAAERVGNPSAGCASARRSAWLRPNA